MKNITIHTITRCATSPPLFTSPVAGAGRKRSNRESIITKNKNKMKNCIYALTVLLLFTAAACGGGKRSKPAAASVQTEILGIDIKLTKDFEQYDTELLNRLKLWANDTWTDDRGWQILPDGTLIEINRSWGSPDLYILPKGSHFGLLRRYHDNGKSRGAEIIWLDGKTGEELCREKIYNP